MKPDEMVKGKTYLVSDIYGQKEMRVERIEVGEERLCLTGFHDEFYLEEESRKNKKGETTTKIVRKMRSTNYAVSVPLKHITSITEVAQGAKSLQLLPPEFRSGYFPEEMKR